MPASLLQGPSTKQLTYSAALTDIHNSCRRERGHWSRRAARKAAATFLDQPLVLAAAGIGHKPDGNLQKSSRGFEGQMFGALDLHFHMTQLKDSRRKQNIKNILSHD